MHVVIMARPRSYDSGRPAKPGGRANEDRLRTCGEEPIQEVLREPEVDLAVLRRRAQRAVEPRKVDVDVEPILV